jgi:hypothetical protein
MLIKKVKVQLNKRKEIFLFIYKQSKNIITHLNQLRSFKFGSAIIVYINFR